MYYLLLRSKKKKEQELIWERKYGEKVRENNSVIEEERISEETNDSSCLFITWGFLSFPSSFCTRGTLCSFFRCKVHQATDHPLFR